MANGNGGGNGKKRKITRTLGCRPKCTKERTKEIASLVAAGVSQKAASETCEIHDHTFCLWMTKGREGKAPCYVAFYNAIERARHLWMAKAERAIAEAGDGPKGDWRALAWMLERRHDEYRPPEQRQKHSGDAANPLAISIIKVPQFAEEPTDGDGGADPDGG